MLKPNKRELVKMGQWLIDGNTGLSSLSLMSVYLTSGNGGECAARIYAPSDPSDFKRCVDFLETCIDPSNRFTLIFEMSTTTKQWQNIKDDWFILMNLYNEEKKQDSAPKLYKKMKELGL